MRLLRSSLYGQAPLVNIARLMRDKFKKGSWLHGIPDWRVDFSNSPLLSYKIKLEEPINRR